MRLVPEDIEKPGEVILYEKGWSMEEIIEAVEKDEKTVIKIVQKYWTIKSKSLIEAIAVRNVKILLEFMNIKTSSYL